MSGDESSCEQEKGEKSFGCKARDRFRRFAQATSAVVGSAWSFIIAVLIIVVWGATGPAFGYSDTWQLVINTGTTIVTFLMVFLIQNTQNRDAKAIHLKLDELIRTQTGARDELVDLEKLTDDELKVLEQQFERIRGRANQKDQHHNAARAVEKVESELKERGTR